MTARTLPWDWYSGEVPANVALDGTAFLETTYSFLLYRSEEASGLCIGRGTSVYLGVMFDVGPRGRISIGEYTLMNGAWLICDANIEIGDYALISWNVVIMDTYRVPLNPTERRRVLEALPRQSSRRLPGTGSGRPVRIGRNVWIGFDTCILPGVTIGEGSVVGARSVVAEDIPPYCIAAGNPARVIRSLEREEAVTDAP